MTLALSVRNVTKRFGTVVANKAINLNVRTGTVHAIVGENGAGKTTLMNILYGLYVADEGEIDVYGRPLVASGPAEAIRQGIGMIHQHFMLVPTLTVAENVTFGREPLRFGFLVDRQRAEAEVRDLARQYGLDVDPAALVGSLPVSLQQRVEILKALYRGAKLLILDEPTALLTPQETRELLSIVRSLRAGGRTVIFISHKLGEVLSIADTVTVMRHGETVAELPAAGASEQELITYMVGHQLEEARYDLRVRTGAPLLEVDELTVRLPNGLTVIDRLSFVLHHGEILGVAGVAGNGQSELVLALAGYLPVTGGRIRLKGQDVTRLDVRERRDLGLGLVPEDRGSEGIAGSLSVAENLVLGRHGKAPFAQGWHLDTAAVNAEARAKTEEFDVRPRTIEIQARQLSGGNQQKLIIARETAGTPDLLIVSQPTRGLDVGAVEFVHRQLIAQRDNGAAVLLVSLSLDEIMLLSSRILVMYRGQAADLAQTGDRSLTELGLLMMRGQTGAVAQHG